MRDRLRVPIGVDADGATVHLDLKEAAQQGMGPHGLVIGATGSGKSELLRTLVLGLAMTHSPELLNLVLVDFKGGATFAGLSDLPHVSAVITNLAEELSLVDRMQDALSGEMVRRQELLGEPANVASVRDYEQARAAGEALDPLPSLLIVVDEFSELLSARPELIDLFVTIGRLGRSLGLHLLLASQRLEEGRLRGLGVAICPIASGCAPSARPSHARCSASQTPMSCRRCPDSAISRPTSRPCCGSRRPMSPGRLASLGPARRSGGTTRSIVPFSVAEVRRQPQADLAAESVDRPGSADEHGSVLDLAVARMAGRGPEAHRVWLPPLDVPDTLDRADAGPAVEVPDSAWSRHRGAPRRTGRTSRHGGPAGRAAARRR